MTYKDPFIPVTTVAEVVVGLERLFWVETCGEINSREGERDREREIQCGRLISGHSTAPAGTEVYRYSSRLKLFVTL